jgi:hypothetical protein
VRRKEKKVEAGGVHLVEAFDVTILTEPAATIWPNWCNKVVVNT